MLGQQRCCPCCCGQLLRPNVRHNQLQKLRHFLWLQVRKGIYVDGGPKLADYVSSGKAEPSSVKWYFKYSGWGGGQLASELERSVWYPVSCSSDLLTADVSPDAPDEMWCSIMELVDDDFRRTSEQVRIEGRRQENTDD